VPALAARYAGAIRQVQARGPYLLGGWSLGGVIAYEMAQALRRTDEQVRIVALLDSALPSAAEPPLTADPADFLRDLARRAGALLPQDLDGDGDVWARAVALAQGLAVLPEGAAEEHLRRWYRVYAANLAAWSAYRPARYPGRVALLLASDGAGERGVALAAWRDLVTGELETADVPGDHYGMLADPHLGALARCLGRALDDADQPPGHVTAPARAEPSPPEGRRSDVT
jgi:thioesterase domain-containing protein